jgi:hypothetical protein
MRRSVGGPSNQALKRTAACSGVGVCVSLATALRLFVRHNRT